MERRQISGDLGALPQSTGTRYLEELRKQKQQMRGY